MMPDCRARPPRQSWLVDDAMESSPAGPQLSAVGAGTREMGSERVVRLGARRALIAMSPAMREVRRQVEQAAESDAAVLLLGESGAGKELIARIIHKLSQRSSRKLIKANCAIRPEALLESELFGHKAGAAAARPAQTGKFETGHLGTILLDNIGELPASVQGRFLQTLEEGEFSRRGSASIMPSDVRVIASSIADLWPAVESRDFREDLYDWLSVFTIRVPPLRERGEDLPYLLNHLMTSWAVHYGRPRRPITRHILEACASYSWPGNVRELENFVKRYLLVGDPDLALDQLHPVAATGRTKRKAAIPIDEGSGRGGCDLKSLVRDLKQDAERAAIVHALEQAGGNRQNAANLLRISLRGLHYKMRAYGIESSSSRARDCAVRDEAVNLRPIASAGRNIGAFPSSGGKLLTMDRAGSPPVR